MLGDKIKELRIKNKLSQQKIGNIFGISQQAVGKWENNIAEPDSLTLMKLADYFGVTVDYLLDREPTTIEDSKNPNKNEFQYIARGGQKGTLKFKSDEDMQRALKILQTLAEEQFSDEK